MSRFTLRVASRIAAECGLPSKGVALWPVLRAAEAAHDAAFVQMEAERENPLQNKRSIRDQRFVAAARTLAKRWAAMDEDGRKRLAWAAAYGGMMDNPASKWLRAAEANAAPSAEAPYGVIYDGIEYRIQQMIDALAVLPMETPRLPAKRGAKKQLSGLEAANAMFATKWEAVAGKSWYPMYSLTDENGPRVCDNAEAKVFLAFAEQLNVPTPYELKNCFSASGGHGDGISQR